MSRRPLIRRLVAAVGITAVVLAGCAKMPPGLGEPAPVPEGSAPPPSAAPTASQGEPSATPTGHSASASSTPLPSGWITGKPVSDRKIPPGSGHSSGPNTTDRIVLTYDDCPTSLDAFKKTVTGVEALGVRIVLFPLGNCIQKGTFDVDFARQHGMFVYSHSVNHPQFTKISDDAIRKQLKPPAVQGAWVRPPYGAANAHVEQVVHSVGMKIWQWDFDTEDWRGKPQEQVVSEVSQYAEKGDTILMHMQWHAFNTDAVAQMKAGVEARGLQLCAINGPATADGPFGC